MHLRVSGARTVSAKAAVIPRTVLLSLVGRNMQKLALFALAALAARVAKVRAHLHARHVEFVQLLLAEAASESRRRLQSHE